MTKYYLADTHFGHENIIRYDGRPFKDAEENDRVMIERWNTTVGQDDDVYILGDVSAHKTEKTINLMKRLNGNKHLVIGNHDRKLLKDKRFRDCFVEIADYMEVNDESGHGVVLSHYPMFSFKNQHRGWVQLYGHIHNNMENDFIEKTRREMHEGMPYMPLNIFNVGVMMPWMDYTPKTLNEIMRANIVYEREGERG